MKVNSGKKLLILTATLLLGACDVSSLSSIKDSESFSSSNSSNSEVSQIIGTPEVSSSEPTEIPYAFLNESFGKEEEMHSIGEFTPSKFDASSVSTTKETLGDGVERFEYSLKLTNGNNVKADVVEINTDKAAIRTNCADSIDTVNNQIDDFENKHEGVKVMAAVNGDYFPTGVGGTCVNAYVKEKEIIKAGHDDHGIYDYTNLNADIPASMPMLLGVSGHHAKIGSIIESSDASKVVPSKLSYALYTGKSYGEASKVAFNYQFNQSTIKEADAVVISDGSQFSAEVGQKTYKIQLIKDSNSCFVYGKVTKIKTISNAGRLATSSDFKNGYIYLISKENLETNLEVGDYVGYCVDSSDSSWLGYTDIIGGRHSLVENGAIASTVTLENANGAQRKDTPRTAGGIKPDGKVCLVAVEALRYGGVSTSVDDTYGFDLPELAEFMRYIGCYDALNFDGGGSTQLITANNNGTGTRTVQVRSSDYGTAGLNDSRRVYNTILVTTR